MQDEKNVQAGEDIVRDLFERDFGIIPGSDYPVYGMSLRKFGVMNM